MEEYGKYKEELAKEIGKFKASRLAELPDQDQETSIYMVLQSMKEKRRLNAFAQEECCSKKFIVGNRKHNLREPPFPDLVIWKNKDRHTYIRVFISYLITLIIVLGSYLLIGVIEFEK